MFIRNIYFLFSFNILFASVLTWKHVYRNSMRHSTRGGTLLPETGSSLKIHLKGDLAYFRASVLKWPMSSTVQSCILCSSLCTAGRFCALCKKKCIKIDVRASCLFHICKFKSKSHLLLFILPICSFNDYGIKKPNEQYFRYQDISCTTDQIRQCFSILL